MPTPKAKKAVYATTHSQILSVFTSDFGCKNKKNNNQNIGPTWAVTPSDLQYPVLPQAGLQSMPEVNPSRVYPVVDDHEESVDLTPAAYRRSCSIL